MAQRIKRLIQTGEFVPLKQENLELVIHARPLSTSSTKRETTEAEDKLTDRLDDFAQRFPIRKRRVRRLEQLTSTQVASEQLPAERLAIAASGIDLERSIIAREVSSFTYETNVQKIILYSLASRTSQT